MFTSCRACDALSIALVDQHPIPRMNIGGHQLDTTNLPVHEQATEDTGKPQPIVQYLKRSPMGQNYYTEINVGNPPQTIDVIFDTGSTGLWLISSACNTSSCNHQHNHFNKNLSETYRSTGESFGLLYGSGIDIVGNIGVDEVQLNGLTIKAQSFGEAKWISGALLQELEVEGVFGLANEGLSPEKSTSPFLNLVSQKLIPEPVFSFYLAKNPDKDLTSGAVLLGGVCKECYEGEIDYVPLTSASSWEFKVDDIYMIDNLEGTPKKVSACKNGCNVTIDTGSDMIAGPSRSIEQLNNLLHAYPEVYGLYRLQNCDYEPLPDLVITINGHDYPIESREFLVNVEMPDLEEVCYSGLKALDDSSLPNWLLGNLFIRNYYTVFDVENQRIGFAKSKQY